MESNLRSGIHVIKDFACKVCNIESLTHVNYSDCEDKYQANFTIIHF